MPIPDGWGPESSPACTHRRILRMVANTTKCGGEIPIAVPQAGCHHFGNPFGAFSFRGSAALRESYRSRDSSREDPSDARFAVCLALGLVLRCIISKLRLSCCPPRTEFPFRGASRRRNEGASNSCYTSQCPTKFGKWPLCSSLREDWVCGTLRDCVPRHIGPAGLTLSLW